jgi:hypothetical protein
LSKLQTKLEENARFSRFLQRYYLLFFNLEFPKLRSSIKEHESMENDPSAYDYDGTNESPKDEKKSRAEPNLLPPNPNVKPKKSDKPKNGQFLRSKT